MSNPNIVITALKRRNDETYLIRLYNGNNKPASAPTPAPITAAGSTSADEPKPIFKSYTPPVSQEPVKAASSNDDMEVQTPQVFKFNKLLKVYVNGIKRNIDAEDDTILANALNFKIFYVEGSSDNFKVNTAEDASYAEARLKSQATEQ